MSEAMKDLGHFTGGLAGVLGGMHGDGGHTREGSVWTRAKAVGGKELFGEEGW